MFLRCVLLLCCAPLVFAQTSEVMAILKDSEAAWNRGDLEKFSSYYEDSPQTTFIGKTVTKGGPKEVLARYKRGYPTRDAMGTLTFSEIEMRPLGAEFVLVNGRFALERIAAGGGNASGRVTLVLRKTPAGWKIIHDHSS
jgi:uncharacterized protein (TIGR02246 family)